MQKVLPNYLCYFSKENDRGTIYQFYYLKKKKLQTDVVINVISDMSLT